jgi:hypothetical protein
VHEEIKELMATHGLSKADLEYILNFMKKEKLSPQLMMRKIKSVEALEKKQGAKAETEKMKIEHLQNELEVKTRALDEANNKLEELGQTRQQEDEIRSSLEKKSEILDAELDELRSQLDILKEMQIMPADQMVIPDINIESLVKAINLIINELKVVIAEYEDFTGLFLPMVQALSEALVNPDDLMFDSDDLAAAIDDYLALESLTKQETKIEQIKDLPKASTPTPVQQKMPVTQISYPTPDRVDESPKRIDTSKPVEPSKPVSTPKRIDTPKPVEVSEDDSPAHVSIKGDSTDYDSPLVKPSDRIKIAQKSEEKPDGSKEEISVEPEKPTKIATPPPQEAEIEKVSTDSASTEASSESSSTESGGFMKPSELIKRRQQALAEQEAKRKAEEDEIAAKRAVAAQKAASDEIDVDKETKEQPVDTSWQRDVPPSRTATKEMEKPVEQKENEPETVKTETETKPESKPEPVTKPELKPQPKSEPAKPKVEEKTIKILDLFIEFISESTNTKNFNDRISSICDMDEAYVELGSIGLSQLYSYVGRPFELKNEVIELLKSWKTDGPPR